MQEGDGAIVFAHELPEELERGSGALRKRGAEAGGFDLSFFGMHRIVASDADVKEKGKIAFFRTFEQLDEGSGEDFETGLFPKFTFQSTEQGLTWADLPAGQGPEFFAGGLFEKEDLSEMVLDPGHDGNFLGWFDAADGCFPFGCHLFSEDHDCFFVRMKSERCKAFYHPDGIVCSAKAACNPGETA